MTHQPPHDSTSGLPFPNAAPGPSPDAQAALPDLRQPLAQWRLWLPLLLQTLLIVAVPAQDAYTYTTGQTVVLQTAPVDPYDFLRGYYQTLGYEVSNVDTLAQLPGGEILADRSAGNPIYVVLEAPEDGSGVPPQAWQPIRVSRDRPTNLPTNQIALKGKTQEWQVAYGLETYYMPEDQREQINQTITQLQSQQPQAFVVEVKIDGRGNAVPVSLWLAEQNYRF